MGREGVELMSLGARVQDVLYKVDRLPGNGELSVIKNVGVREGGVAANFAVAFSHLGGRAGIITVLGRDEVGRWLLSRLKEEGVDCSRVIVRDVRSLRLHIFEDFSLRRVFFVENMKTLSMTLDEIDMGYVSTASMLFTDLFLGKTAVKAIEKVKEVGLKVSIVIPHGLSVMGPWGLGKEDALRAMELADLVATSVLLRLITSAKRTLGDFWKRSRLAQK